MTQKKTDSDPLYVAAIERGMTVLRVLGEADGPLSASAIARAAGLTQSTTWRICYTLQKLGYVRADRIGQFRAGLPLLALGHAALADEDVPGIAAPLMEDLANRFQGVAGLCVRDGDAMLFVGRQQAKTAMLTMNLRTGSRVPILTSAVGWALLAATPEEERPPLFASLLKGQEKKIKPRVLDMLQEQLRLYPQRGFMLNLEVFYPNVGFVGVPLVHPDTGEIFALNCGGVLSSITARKLEEEVGPALLKAVDLIRSALGGSTSTQRARAAR